MKHRLLLCAFGCLAIAFSPAQAGAKKKKNPSLKIESTPPGATVLVDSNERGKAPLTIDDLPPGPHLVEVKLDGHGVVERVVRLHQKKKTKLKIELSKDVGRLRVKATPGSPVYVDDLYAGRAPGPLWVASGKHTIRIVSPEVPVYKGEFEVAAGGEAAVEPVFLAKVIIETVPAGKRIAFDGKEVGRSPVTLDVQRGPHSIQVSEPRFEDAYQEIVATLEKETKIQIVLKPSRRVWSRELKGLIGAPVLAAGMAIWRTETGLIAVDVETGEPKWTYKSLGRPTKTLVLQDALLVAQEVGSNGAVASVAIADGKKRWLVETTGHIAGGIRLGGKPLRLTALSEGKVLYAVDPATGKIALQVKIPKALGVPNAASVHAAAHTYFTTKTGWLTGADLRGRIAWRQRLGSIAPPAPILAGGNLYAWSAWTKGARSMVHAFNPRSRKKRWSHNVPAAVGERLFGGKQVVVAASGNKLFGFWLNKPSRAFALDLGATPRAIAAAPDGMLALAGGVLHRIALPQGKVVWKADVGKEACKPVVDGGMVLLGSGSAVLALGLDSGAKAWSFQTRGRACGLVSESNLVALGAGKFAYRLDGGPSNAEAPAAAAAPKAAAQP